ncbi:hypothetical protein LTR84_000284 [Exophiala bonariae]|uniref:F-box domain-containing protein n=1 Tax=Exophiala bonariae TaxID=1690606 RepID=A0AAV9NQU1_9EURO|nr:hypothetical protein LTR84_000284 [Exophiala bonariae]
MSLWTGFPAGIGQGQMIQPYTQPRRPLKCQAKACDFERKLGHKFVVNEELLQNIEEDNTNEDAVLLDMPYEILLTIFDSLAHSPSQVALALTCKRMAMVARDVHLHLSAFSAKYAGFLPKTVFDVPELMTQLKPWMPAELRLCNHCLTNRPRAEEYWATIIGCEVSNFWIQKTGWNFHNASWHKQVHDICPACHASCSLSDYVECNGCRALGRLGDVDWTRVSGNAGRFAT